MNMITTQSHIKAWTLATFGGCRIFSVRRRPTFGIGSYTFYRTSWVLVPSEVAMAAGHQQ